MDLCELQLTLNNDIILCFLKIIKLKKFVYYFLAHTLLFTNVMK